MFLLILLVIVFIVIVFLLGSYTTSVNNTADAPYPTPGQLAQINRNAGLVSNCSSCKPKGDSCVPAGCAAPVTEPKPCKKHRKRRCYVCNSSEDDGFSTGIAFISTPAPF